MMKANNLFAPPRFKDPRQYSSANEQLIFSKKFKDALQNKMLESNKKRNLLLSRSSFRVDGSYELSSQLRVPNMSSLDQHKNERRSNSQQEAHSSPAVKVRQPQKMRKRPYRFYKVNIKQQTTDPSHQQNSEEGGGQIQPKEACTIADQEENPQREAAFPEACRLSGIQTEMKKARFEEQDELIGVKPAPLLLQSKARKGRNFNDALPPLGQGKGLANSHSAQGLALLMTRASAEGDEMLKAPTPNWVPPKPDVKKITLKERHESSASLMKATDYKMASIDLAHSYRTLQVQTPEVQPSKISAPTSYKQFPPRQSTKSIVTLQFGTSANGGHDFKQRIPRTPLQNYITRKMSEASVHSPASSIERPKLKFVKLRRRTSHKVTSPKNLAAAKNLKGLQNLQNLFSSGKNSAMPLTPSGPSSLLKPVSDSESQPNGHKHDGLPGFEQKRRGRNTAIDMSVEGTLLRKTKLSVNSISDPSTSRKDEQSSEHSETPLARLIQQFNSARSSQIGKCKYTVPGLPQIGDYKTHRNNILSEVIEEAPSRIQANEMRKTNLQVTFFPPAASKDSARESSRRYKKKLGQQRNKAPSSLASSSPKKKEYEAPQMEVVLSRNSKRVEVKSKEEKSLNDEETMELALSQPNTLGEDPYPKGFRESELQSQQLQVGKQESSASAVKLNVVLSNATSVERGQRSPIVKGEQLLGGLQETKGLLQAPHSSVLLPHLDQKDKRKSLELSSSSTESILSKDELNLTNEKLSQSRKASLTLELRQTPSKEPSRAEQAVVSAACLSVAEAKAASAPRSEISELPEKKEEEARRDDESRLTSPEKLCQVPRLESLDQVINQQEEVQQEEKKSSAAREVVSPLLEKSLKSMSNSSELSDSVTMMEETLPKARPLMHAATLRQRPSLNASNSSSTLPSALVGLSSKLVRRQTLKPELQGEPKKAAKPRMTVSSTFAKTIDLRKAGTLRKSTNTKKSPFRKLTLKSRKKSKKAKIQDAPPEEEEEWKMEPRIEQVVENEEEKKEREENIMKMKETKTALQMMSQRLQERLDAAARELASLHH